MRVHWLQHVPFEGLGLIESWIAEKSFGSFRHRMFAGDPLPAPAEIDFLIAMGGPMSVNDEAGFPWLVDEKQLIREVIEAGKPVLGVCLGAQLIVSAMGASVYRAPEPEVGWFSVEGSVCAALPSLRFPPELTVFHWHGETFDLPASAVRLLSSPVCPNQAFLLGDRVLGMQFHLETTQETATALVNHCPEDLQGGHRYVQAPGEILRLTQKHSAGAEKELRRILDYLAGFPTK